MSDFVHLHVHSEYSTLDGMAKVDDYVEKAVKLGMPALALTDHGNICGAPEFYWSAKKAGIEPIIGEEFYYVPSVEEARNKPSARARAKSAAAAEASGSDSSDEASAEPDKDRYHVVILARGYRGYRTLAELSTEAHRNFYHKPLVDRGTLEQLSRADRGSLIVLSGCAASRLCRFISAGDRQGAVEELLWWRELFPNFYIELQNHNIGDEEKLNNRLIKLAQRYTVPMVITNDPHYAHKGDHPYHDALLAIQTASNVDDPDRFRFSGEGYHLRGPKAMRAAFAGMDPRVVQHAFKSTTAIARACALTVPHWDKRSWNIPKYPDSEDSYETLKRLAYRGLRDRGLKSDRSYVSRLKHELGVIKQVGIADFLLITRDIIQEAVRRGIPVGPGRGSVCGSLVSYCADIHKIDPVKYNLLFERFLNPARPRMPDIDTDFGQERREELFDYIVAKYGEENVMRVCAYQHMKTRKAYLNLAKAHGILWKDALKVSKNLNEDDELTEQLPAEIQDNYPDLAKQLKKLAGIKSGFGRHAAGMIIAEPEMKIKEMIPQLWIASSKTFVAQYDLEAIEHMGFMKQDILGLRTLDTIAECVRLVKERHGKELDVDSWVPDTEKGDDKIYKMLTEGRTGGVFQMEGGTNTRGIQEIKCTCFEDIVSCTSLYRTGPIVAGFPEQFVANRLKGIENIEYVDPRLKPILDPTWGVILYQEQVMEIAKDLAGFNMEMVDDIKEAIKHKKSAFMKSLKPKFVKGCVRNGMAKGGALHIWAQIEGYSGYSYNRSHAVAYSFITYQTARLKRLYPLEFITALIRTVDPGSKEAKEKRASYLREALDLGFKVLPPDINISGTHATPDYEANAIRFGLTDLKGIGDAHGKKLVKAREELGGQYSSLEQVAEAARNVGVLKALEDSTALSSFGLPGDLVKAEELLTWIFIDRLEEYRKEYKKKVKLPNGKPTHVRILGEIIRSEKRVTRNGDPYMTWVIRYSPSTSYTIRLWQDTEELWDLKPQSVVLVSGVWETKWENVSLSDPGKVQVIKRAKSKSLSA